MSKIEIKNFTAERGTFKLRPFDLTIEDGEIFAILGYTGSGKTVLLEAIGGMFSGKTGVITYDGVNVASIPPENRGLGFVYQSHALFPHMKVRDNIEYGLKMKKVPKNERRKRSKELMEMFSIDHIADQYPGTISGGESQRTAIARAIALEPEVLLLDEPFSALDPSTRNILYREIKNIHEKLHCTIVFVTHDFKEAEILADRVGILLGGELLDVTEGKGLMERTYCDKVEMFLGRK